jgi:hypothetical protein
VVASSSPSARQMVVAVISLPDDLTEGATHRCISVLDEIVLVVEAGGARVEHIQEQLTAIRGQEDRVCGVVLVT